MIRRRHPDGHLLITQDDHARVCGVLARVWGNLGFPRPEPFADFLAGVVLHDCGWADADADPAPTANGLPPDIFDPPPPSPAEALAHDAANHAIWERSARLAGLAGSWAQLLVSVHVLTLSSYAAGRALSLPQRFAANRFQHRQIELQESLRRALGLSLDLPLTSGLADANDDLPAREWQLRDQYHHLQTLDLLSLAVCCSSPPSDASPPLGVDETCLHWRRYGDELRIQPWPFALPEVKVEIPCRLVPRRAYASPQELQDALSKSPWCVLETRVIP